MPIGLCFFSFPFFIVAGAAVGILLVVVVIVLVYRSRRLASTTLQSDKQPSLSRSSSAPEFANPMYQGMMISDSLDLDLEDGRSNEVFNTHGDD